MFKKKEDTVESLVKECNAQYRDFIGHLTKAHYIEYFEFKKNLKEDFNYLNEKIATSTQEKVTMTLLNHFKSQLKFVNDNPFSAENQDIKKFVEDNYPYKDKIEILIQKTDTEVQNSVMQKYKF